MANKITTVDQYIASFAPAQQQVLQQIREAIHRGVPGAEEKIRYAMPAILLERGNAIHFAGWKKHIGLYPVPVLDEPLETQLTAHRTAKDAIGFSWAKPMPYELIEDISAAIAAKAREKS